MSEATSALKEVLQFLQLDSRPELKSVALDNVLGLTSSPDGLSLLNQVPELFHLLANIAQNDKSEVLRKDSALALINLSADKETASKMSASKDLISKLWSTIKSLVHPSADPACMILSNLTIDKMNCDQVYTTLSNGGISLSMIIDSLCLDTKKSDVKLHYLGPLVSNLSQLSAVRTELLAKNCALFSRLLPFSEFSGSSVRRGGVIGAIRNCCFDSENHQMLLKDMDLLPRLLLPLAGPTPEIFEESEIEKLPIDLQYLDEDKEIESDPDIKKLLLEALLQLCATQTCREILRDQNAYLILRELHKVEKDETVHLAIENVVDILIKKEEEINLDNYKTVQVPDEIQKEMEI